MERARQRQVEEAKRRAAKERAGEVIPYLRALGIRAAHAAQAAALCESIPDAPLKQRVRRALSCFGRGTTIPAPAARLAT